jgi:hypothetical protein
MRKIVLIGLVTTSVSLLVACSKEEERVAWNCDGASISGGRTLVCRTSSKLTGTSDGVPTSGSGSTTTDSTRDGVSTVGGAAGSTSGGTLDGAGGTASAGGGGDFSYGGTGGGLSLGAGYTSDGFAGNFPTGTWSCSAGTLYCPPLDAQIGTNLGAPVGSTSDGVPSTGSGTGSSIGGSAGSTSGGVASGAPTGGTTTDGTGNVSGGSGAGGGKEVDEKDREKGEGGGSGSVGGSGATKDGAGSVTNVGAGGAGATIVGQSYTCTNVGGNVSCTRDQATCGAGLQPGPTGGCVSVGSGGASSTGGTTTDGATGTSGAGGGLIGGGATNTDTNKIKVTFDGYKPNADGTSTWTYRVEEVGGGQDLSNWVLGTNCRVLSSNIKGELVHPDPNAGITGIKWNTGAGFSSGTFTITVSGASAGNVSYATKAPGVVGSTLTGPICR